MTQQQNKSSPIQQILSTKSKQGIVDTIADIDISLSYILIAILKHYYIYVFNITVAKYKTFIFKEYAIQQNVFSSFSVIISIIVL